jgi:methionyl-tRNA formyltransferase
MGTPEFAVVPLERLIYDGYEVAAVYTQPDGTAGRGRSLVASPVKRAALASGLMVMQPPSLREEKVVAELAALQPNVIVVAAYGQILPKAVLELPPHKCINLHPSLLPRFRGASPVAAAILSGGESTGVSVMIMDEGLDTGPVLAKRQVPILPEDTTGSLISRLSVIASELLIEVLALWPKGELTPQPQNEAEASYSGTISKEDGEIDWGLAAVQIWRQVRAYQPWPGCYTRWRGKQLKVLEAVPLPAREKLPAGQVVAIEGKDTPLGVSTGDGVLGLLKVQLEGRRALTADEFLRGQRGLIGAVLPSN